MSRLSIAVIVTATLVACDSDSSRPPQLPTTPNTPTTPTVTTTRLELSGPGTIHIGKTVQFTVTAHQSDGTTRDATSDVTWRSFNPNVVTMSAPGTFTGKAKGETSVSVALANRSAVINNVIVVPEGTFRLIGTVRDSGVVVDALVRVEDEAIGHVDVQTVRGQYVVYGVAGDTRVTVMKDGYEQETKRLVVTSHQRIDFDLALSRPRADVTGRYTLTVVAAPECTALPAELRSRSYQATVEQSGPTVTVTLAGPQFVISSGRTLNRFTGLLETDRITFRLAPTLDPYYYYYFYLPDVFEVLTLNSYYAFEGTVVTLLGSADLSGTLDGAVGRFTGPPYWPSTRCRSRNHRFVMARQT